MSSRRTSKRGSRSGSMEEEDHKEASERESVRTNGGKIINRLETGENRDSN
jgi:hypothetical protein